MVKSKTITAALALALLTIPAQTLAAPILDSTSDTQVSIEGGELTLNASGVGNFGTHKLESKVKDIFTNFDGNFIVNDSRGTYEGWNLNVSASDFIEVLPVEASTQPFTFSSEYMSLAQPTVTNTTHSGAVLGDEVTFLANDYTQLTDTGINVANALVDKGAGQFTFDFGTEAIKLKLDPSVVKIDTVNYPNTHTPYTSTISWTLVSGPI